MSVTHNFQGSQASSPQSWCSAHIAIAISICPFHYAVRDIKAGQNISTVLTMCGLPIPWRPFLFLQLHMQTHSIGNPAFTRIILLSFAHGVHSTSSRMCSGTNRLSTSLHPTDWKERGPRLPRKPQRPVIVVQRRSEVVRFTQTETKRH